MEVNSKRKLKGIASRKRVSEEGKNRTVTFYPEPCSTLTFENNMHIVTLLKIFLKSTLVF